MPEPEGNTAPAWTAQLPENLRGNEALTVHKTIGDLAGDYVKVKGTAGELEGRLANALFIPGEDATDEQRAEFFAKLGRPKTPEEYGFKKPDNLPEGMPYDEEGEKKFRKLLFDMGVSNRDAVRLFDEYHKDAIGAWDKIQNDRLDRHNKAVQTLQAEWGDKYKENAEKAIRVAALAGEEFTKWLNDSGLGSEPRFVKAFHRLYELIGEDTIAAGVRTGRETDAASVLYPEMAARQNT